MQEVKTPSAYRQHLRERILETAMTAFATEGIRAVRMDDIAARLSISKRTLYEIYTNKEDLLFEGIREFNERRRAELEEFAADSRHNVLDIVLYFYRKRSVADRRINPVFYEDIVRYPRVLYYLNGEKEENYRRFAGFLARGVAEGYFRDDVDYSLISHLFEAIGGYLNEHRLYQHYSFDELFFNLVIVSLRGFCTTQGIQVLDAAVADLRQVASAEKA